MFVLKDFRKPILIPQSSEDLRAVLLVWFFYQATLRFIKTMFLSISSSINKHPTLENKFLCFIFYYRKMSKLLGLIDSVNGLPDPAKKR